MPAFSKIVRRVLPKTLRTQLLLMTLVVVSVPIASAGYVLEVKGRAALIEEKQAKLFGLAKVLDGGLAGGFDELLADFHGDRDDRAAKVAFLNGKLRQFTDIVADANPGVGVGYYSKSLNAIITYGPSREFGDKVGMPIPLDHPGRKVLTAGEKAVESGPQVRGLIMNAMWPITRNGQVVGYVWANELADAVERQTGAMDHAVFGVTVAGILLGLALTLTMSAKLSRDIGSIKRGLGDLQIDLRKPIHEMPGEMGEIVDAVNAMATALLDARSLTENIMNSIADGVIAVDVGGRITSANPAARHMIGLPAPRIVGQPYVSLFNSEVDFSSVLLETLDSGKEHIGIPLEYPLRDRTLHVSASSSLLRDGAGKTIGAVVVFKDLSERMHLQQQIMRADRLAALGELVAGIAHEIRNPLTSIRGFMQYLQHCKDIREWQEYGPLIVRQVDSLNRIISELLEFGRSTPPHIGPVQVNSLIAEVTLLVGNKSAVRIDLDLSPEVPTIEADGEEIKQVILNLLINAGQAIAGAGVITVSTRVDNGREVVIQVVDTGCGIAADNLDKVFDPFFSTKPAGTGLGLAVVRRIIEAHQGRIHIESVPDEGTVVTLRLPENQRTKVGE